MQIIENVLETHIKYQKIFVCTSNRLFCFISIFKCGHKTSITLSFSDSVGQIINYISNWI